MKKVVDGLVLKETRSGESDKHLTVLGEQGKMFFIAKGACSARSKIRSVCRIYTYANFEYYEKNDLRWVSGGSPNNSFFGTGAELDGYALAAYIAQIALEITGEEAEAADVLRMTLNTLYCIEKKQKPLPQIKATYELFAACNSGFSPDLSGCCKCGRAECGTFWLDVMNGALICEDCHRKHAGSVPAPEIDEYSTRNILVPLDPSALASMRYVCASEPRRIFAFSLAEGESMDRFCRAAETYLLNHLERGFETLDFYRSVKE